jgi:hypothetical protein
MANTHSIFLTKTPAKKIFAFELSASNQLRLLTNLELNGLANSLRLELSSKFIGLSNSETECNLDSLLPSISQSCIIKMDVEGGELNILHGAKRVLDLQQIRWIIETHSQELETQCMQILERAGFVTKIVPNAWWRLFILELRVRPQNRWLIATRSSIPQL